MSTSVVLSLAQSGDDDVREIGLQRLLRKELLTDEEKALLRERIPTLPHEDLLTLLARHGDLGKAPIIVTRIVDGMAREQLGQDLYFGEWTLDTLSRQLDADAFADLVERVAPTKQTELAEPIEHAAPTLSPWNYARLLSRMRGCALFTALATKDGNGPEWALLAPTGTEGFIMPIVEELRELRYDERAIRARIEAWIRDGDLGLLLRLRWLMSEVGEDALAELAWQRCLVRFPSPLADGQDHRTTEARRWHWKLVLSWVNDPSPQRTDRLGWLADRLMPIEDFFPGPAFPEDLRTDLGRVLIRRGLTPEWAAPILIDQLGDGSLDTWRKAFAWWRPGSRSHYGAGYALCKKMAMEAPLPLDAPDDFDAALLMCIEDVRSYEREQLTFQGVSIDVERLDEDDYLEFAPLRSDVVPAQYEPLISIHGIVERLLQMPLTQARAARIARMIKGHPRLIQHPRMLEVAIASGPLEPDLVPGFEEIDLYDTRQVELYRRLGGTTADERLREHARRSFESMKAEDRPFAWRASWLPDVADEALLADMRAWVSVAPLRRVLELYPGVPWLVDEHTVEVAAQRHFDAGLSWNDISLLHRAEQIPLLGAFLERRSESTSNDQEFVALLRWLGDHGLPRARQLTLLLGRIERRPPTEDLAPVALRMLPTRAAWEKDGPTVLRAFLRSQDRMSLGAIWWALRQDEEKNNAPKILAAVHLAFATAILEVAAQAADDHDEARLTAALTAVLVLDPPPTIVPRLTKLRHRTGMPERAVERLQAGIELFKSNEGRAPTIDALYEATAKLDSRERDRHESLP